jgi:amino acid transporter
MIKMVIIVIIIIIIIIIIINDNNNNNNNNNRWKMQMRAFGRCKTDTAFQPPRSRCVNSISGSRMKRWSLQMCSM